jgi:hypothetical protein
MKWNQAFFILFFCAASARGGEPGSRLAGSPQGSPLVRDLRAVRKGDKVTLTWSRPNDDANRQSFKRHLALARVCRNITLTASDTRLACTHAVGQVDLEKYTGGSRSATHGKSDSKTTVSLIDMLPEGQDDSGPLQFAVYQGEFRDDRGHRAGFSNPTAVPLAPVLPAKGLHSELDARGVYLIWEDEIESQSSSLKFDYRIYRREKGSSKRVAIPYLRAVVHTPEGERWSGVDTAIEWEKTYFYLVTPVTRVYSQDGQLMDEIEGEDSLPLEITTHDVFAPAAPERLLAVVSHSHKKRSVVTCSGPPTWRKTSPATTYIAGKKTGSSHASILLQFPCCHSRIPTFWLRTSTSTAFPPLTCAETRVPSRRKRLWCSPNSCQEDGKDAPWFD